MRDGEAERDPEVYIELGRNVGRLRESGQVQKKGVEAGDAE